MTDQELREILTELGDEMYIPGEGPVGPVLLREFDRIMAERDKAKRALRLSIETHSVDQRQIERLTRCFLEQARGAQGEA